MADKKDNVEGKVEVGREGRKRKRELFVVVFVSILFLILTWVEFHLTNISQKLPFVNSIFFFGLVNFNIILLLLLLFLIFRNVVKIFVESQGKLIGASLKGKLVAAFVAFSFVPTVLMFLISVFYINSSFDKWFSVKMAGVLKDALEVTNVYYLSAKRENYHFAHMLAREIEATVNGSGLSEKRIVAALDRGLHNYSLHAVEFYPSLFGERTLVLSKSESIPQIPKVSLEFLQKGIAHGIDASTIHHFENGNLIRVIVPVHVNGGGAENYAAIVVSSYVPLSLISKMDDIASAYNDFRDINPLEYPLKSIYLIILVLMTLVILFAATWFGFHLARQLSGPLELLGYAARRIAQGKYSPVEITTGSAEINLLVSSFNQMTHDLEKTLHTLDEHSRYIEIVLSNVSAGVISVDSIGKITTINRHAGKLLKIQTEKYIGREYRELLGAEHLRLIEDTVQILRKYKASSLQKELRVTLEKETLLIQASISLMRDEGGRDLGMVLVFDDMSMLVNAQRAAAWREVARRIAHEIKNPLTPIKLSAQRLEKKFGQDIKDPAFAICTSTIIKQVDELKEMVNEFSNFARLPQAKLAPSSLNQVIEEALVLYREGHKEVDFKFVSDANIPIFNFDRDQLKRVITNLIDNAVAAVVEVPNEKGQIEVGTQYNDHLGIVKIIVKDNGNGISDEHRARIFDPYFSTKKTGTGLGLAIVKRIIDDHSGFIRSYANEPRGTRFVIELPLVQSQLVATINTESVRKDIT